MNKHNRLLKNKILPWLNQGKALIFIGARQVGKTTLLRSMFGSSEKMLWLNADEERIRIRLKDLNLINLEQLMGDHITVIIDEVQRIENCGLLLKLLVDNYPHVQILASGSSALEIADRIFEPLTGRHIVFKLYGFTMAELYPEKSSFQWEEQLAFHLIYGSYPEVCMRRNLAETLLMNLKEQYLYRDVLIWKDIRKPELLDKLLKLLAYQIGAEVSMHELGKSLNIKSETVENYIDLLEKSFVVFRLQAFSQNSRKEITKMSKIYFWDIGLRNAIIDDFSPIFDRNDIGKLWENYAIAERIKQNNYKGLNRKSFFWRNYSQSEVDYIEIEKNQIYAFELKYSEKKNAKISKAFINSYPDAICEIISPIKIKEFLG